MPHNEQCSTNLMDLIFIVDNSYIFDNSFLFHVPIFLYLTTTLSDNSLIYQFVINYSSVWYK